jgi:hypothetical protein
VDLANIASMRRKRSTKLKEYGGKAISEETPRK